MSADPDAPPPAGGISVQNAENVNAGAPIAGPGRWVSSALWLILVGALALVMVGSAAALVLDFLAPSQPTARGETMIALYVGAQGSLIALYSQRPGSH